MTPAEDGVRLTRDGHLAILTLDNPPLNLLTAPVLDVLERHVAALATDPPRAVLVTAVGEVFSGGVDVATFHRGAAEDQPGQVARAQAEFARHLTGLVVALEALPCPTVAAVDGLCLTAAFELVLACDLLVAAPAARFGLVEATVGLTPAMGGTQRLAQRAGRARAAEAVLTGRIYDAATMHAWGVVTRLADDAAASGQRLAQRLAQGPTQAHAATRRVLAAWSDGGIGVADAVTPSLAAGLFDTEDLAAGVASFLADGPGRAQFTCR